MEPRRGHQKVRVRRAEASTQCLDAPQRRRQVLALGSDEELQQSPMPSGLQAGDLERLEQVQRQMWRWRPTALARGEAGYEVQRKTMWSNVTDQGLQRSG